MEIQGTIKIWGCIKFSRSRPRMGRLRFFLNPSHFPYSMDYKRYVSCRLGLPSGDTSMLLCERKCQGLRRQQCCEANPVRVVSRLVNCLASNDPTVSYHVRNNRLADPFWRFSEASGQSVLEQASIRVERCRTPNSFRCRAKETFQKRPHL
jgi:hypothetical protein